MKKILSSIVGLCMILAGSAVFTSCDDDTNDAINLSGEWEGNMGMFMDYGGYRYDAYNTWIAFHPDYDMATHGYGEEIDYFPSTCPYYCQNLYFEWRIRDQVLYLTYPYNHDLDIAIYDYHFRKSRSVLEFTINDEYFCRLNKLVDYQDNWYWWDHDDNLMRNNNEYYHYMNWADHHLTKSRDGVSEDAPSTNVDVKPENIKLGRDFSKFERVDNAN